MTKRRQHCRESQRADRWCWQETPGCGLCSPRENWVADTLGWVSPQKVTVNCWVLPCFIFISIFFFFWLSQCVFQDLSSLTKDWTHAFSSESTESYPLVLTGNFSKSSNLNIVKDSCFWGWGGENDKKLEYKSLQKKWGKLTKKCNHVTLHDLSLNDIYENAVRSKYHWFKIKPWSYISYNMNVLIAIFQNMLLFFRTFSCLM